MKKQSSALDKFQARNRHDTITEERVYFVNGVEFGTIGYVMSKMQCSRSTITGWERKGLEEAQFSTRKLKLFPMDDLIKWYKENTDVHRAKRNSNRIDEVVGDDDEMPDYSNIEDQINDINGKIGQANEILQIKSTSQKEADRINKIMEALTKAAKLGEQVGELIPKRDTEKVIVEMIATLISGYKKDIKILPKECANRNENDIRGILELNYKSNITNYQKLSKSDIITDGKVFDVLRIVNDLMIDDVSPDDIVDKLGELK